MQSIFCPAELHGLFKYFSFHRLFTQKALELADLLVGRRQFGSGYDLFAGGHGSQATAVILPAPFEDLVGIDGMQAGWRVGGLAGNILRHSPLILKRIVLGTVLDHLTRAYRSMALIY